MVLKRVLHYFILLLVFCLNYTDVFGQNSKYVIDHLELPDEFGAVTANSFVEDNDGFLYLGLSNGFFRYDGHEIKEMTQIDENGYALDFSYVVELAIDKDGEIIIVTRSGVFIFNPDTEHARRFILTESIGIEYRTLYISKTNEIIIGTNKGLRIYDKISGTFESYIHDAFNAKSISHNVVRAVNEDKDGNLWIGTYDKLNKFDRMTKSFESFNLKPKDAEEGRNNLVLRIQPLMDEDSNMLLVGTETGMVLFDIDTNSFKIINNGHAGSQISNRVVKTVYPVNADEIWLGTDFGLNRYTIKSGVFTNFFHNFGNINSLSHDVIHALYLDKQGNLWIGTDNGIDKIYISNNNILFNQIDADKKQYSGSFEVNSISEDSQGNYWFASNEGLFQYHAKKDEFLEYHPPQILHTKVRSVYVDSDDHVWLATSGGLNEYNPQSKKFLSYTAKPLKKGYLESNYVSKTVKDKNGDLWVSTLNKGLYKSTYREGRRDFTPYVLPANSEIQLNRITELFIDDNNNLWLDSFNNYDNVIRLNIASGEIVSFTDNTGSSIGVINDSYLFEDDLWVATTNGIFKWNEKADNFDKKTDLGIHVKGIVADDNFVWITGYSNIYQYDIKKDLIKKIPSYLIRDIKFSRKGYKDSKGRIFFNSLDGFICFDPDQIVFNESNPYVRFTDFEVLGKNRQIDSEFYSELLSNKNVNELEHVELSFNDNSFDISFSSLNLIDNKSVTYSYILEGYDDYWYKSESGHNEAKYVKVQPGDYVFKVLASDTFGNNSDKIRQFRISISPPFYASNVAFVLYFISLVLLLMIGYRIVLSREKYNNTIKLETFQRKKTEELAELKTKFFSTITHELKTPLTLIKAPLERIIKEEQDEDKVRKLNVIDRNASRLIKLVNQILDLRKFEKGVEKLEIQEYDIIEFCRNVFTQFESEALHRELNMTFQSNEESLQIWFDLEKMEKALSNLLSNAYKFTPDKGSIKLILDYKRRSSKLYITVKDSGVGIKVQDQDQVFERFSQLESTNYSNQNGSGIGLSLVKEYVNLHNGSVKFNSKLKKGSEFIIEIPTGKEAYSDYIEKKPINGHSQEMDSVKGEFEIREKGVSAEDKKLPLLLIVEDEKDMREFLEESFQKFYNVITAIDGVDGLKFATKRIPDIIISDVMMPRMDGYELCEKLKTDIRTSHIPIILLSAKGDSKSKLTGVEFGADDYVGKPFQFDYLITKSQNLIKQREKLKKTFINQHSTEISNIELSSLDENFLSKVVKLVEKNIDDSDLNVKSLSDLVGMNHTNFYRKIKGLTGQTANDFIRTIRLKKAAQLMETGKYNVKEVMFMVGFSNSSYFSKSFKNAFGVSPKDFN